MGKYYSLENGNLYIFTTGTDSLIDLYVFPRELNLFEANSAWRISPRVAVVEDILHRTAEKAKIVLNLHEYEEVIVESERIESYFLDSDEGNLIEGIALKLDLHLQEISEPEDA
jgi:hypothetical protein